MIDNHQFLHVESDPYWRNEDNESLNSMVELYTEFFPEGKLLLLENEVGIFILFFASKTSNYNMFRILSGF